jgi:AcrR family transcriptional regulator
VISPPVPGQDPSPLRRGRPGYDLASVLAVAVEVFNERGYDRTSMRDLADRLGIAKSAIYHHVAGKEELLRLALDRALAGLSAATDRARVLPAPAIERLEYLVRSSVEVLEAELPYVTLLLRVRGNTEVERAALDQRRAFDRFVAELVAQAVHDGDIRPDVDAMLTARLVFGLVNSVVEWYRPARRADTRSLADAVCAMIFDGLRTRRGPSRPTGPAGPPRPWLSRWGRSGRMTARPVAIRPALQATAAASRVSVSGAVQVPGTWPGERAGSTIPARASSSRRSSRPAGVCLLWPSGAPAIAPNASSGCTS